MYVCKNCKNDISQYKKICSICSEQNIHFNNAIVIGSVVFSIAVVIGIVLFNIFQEFGVIEIILFLGAIGLIIYCYFKYEAKDEFEEKLKQIIEKTGVRLFHEKKLITVDEFLLECGWKIDNSKINENIKQYIVEVASQQKWHIKDDYIYKRM